MSGLLALLDDVAAIAKLAAASVDDIAASTVKAGSKAAGIIIDDAAVTPKYVTGLSPAREIPIIRKIGIGSLRNKLLILLPAVLILQAIAPWIITPILMLGGLYLCFEGAEKIIHWLRPHDRGPIAEEMSPKDPAHLEEERVRGAVKTDFILSAEIMVLSLSVIEADGWVLRAITLAIVGIIITVAVYGTVALLVKADDLGLRLAAGGNAVLRSFGRGLVSAMPTVFTVLTVVGTAAMLWVGGNLITHGLEVLGYPAIYYEIHHLAEIISGAVPNGLSGFAGWFVTAALDGVLGLILGSVVAFVYLAVARSTKSGQH